jgi:ABC-type glycerol-3-phosphate transport system permease component
MSRSTDRWATHLRLAAGGAIVFAMFYPTIWMVMSAFKNNRELFRQPFSLPVEWRFENFSGAWQTGDLGTLYINSIIVTVTAVLITVFAATAAAFAFARLEFRGRDFLYRILLVGLLLPPPVIAIPLFTQLRDMNLLNTLWALILPGSAWSLALSTFIMRSYFLSLRNDTEEAARLDGASIWSIFWRVSVPMVKPAMLTVAVLNTINVWNELLFALLFISDDSKRTLPAGLIRFYGFHSTDYGLVFAALTVSILPILILYFIMQRQVIAGLTAVALD